MSWKVGVSTRAPLLSPKSSGVFSARRRSLKLTTLPIFKDSVTALSWLGRDRSSNTGILAVGMDDGLIELYGMFPGVNPSLPLNASEVDVYISHHLFCGKITDYQTVVKENCMRKKARFWSYVMQIIYQIMICLHSLNDVFLLIDTAVNRLWVLHACGLTWWPHPFIELSMPRALLWYLAIALVHIPCFGVYYLIAKAKNSFLSKLFPNLYIKSY